MRHSDRECRNVEDVGATGKSPATPGMDASNPCRHDDYLCDACSKTRNFSQPLSTNPLAPGYRWRGRESALEISICPRMACSTSCPSARSPMNRGTTLNQHPRQGTQPYRPGLEFTTVATNFPQPCSRHLTPPLSLDQGVYFFGGGSASVWSAELGHGPIGTSLGLWLGFGCRIGLIHMLRKVEVKLGWLVTNVPGSQPDRNTSPDVLPARVVVDLRDERYRRAHEGH